MYKNQSGKFATLRNLLLVGLIATLTGCATESTTTSSNSASSSSSRPPSGSVQIDWTDDSGAHSSKFYKHIFSTPIENKIVVKPGTVASAKYRNSDNSPIFATDSLVCPSTCPTGQTSVITQSCTYTCSASCGCEVPPAKTETETETKPDTDAIDTVIDNVIDKALSTPGYDY